MVVARAGEKEGDDVPAKLAHIAIDADNVDRAIRFYQAVLGWSFTPWGPPNFYHIKGAGVHGALQERQAPIPEGRKGIECTFAVKDLTATMKRVEDAGGDVVSQPFNIESVGTLVRVTDTEANEFILMEYTPSYAQEIGIDSKDL